MIHWTIGDGDAHAGKMVTPKEHGGEVQIGRCWRGRQRERGGNHQAHFLQGGFFSGQLRREKNE